MDNKEDMIKVINEYGGDCEICNCENCDIEQIEECYYKANDICNDTFAESIDYGGYDSADEFWENLLD